MRLGFIGAGKVGTALGIYLKEKGFQLSGYCSRSKDSGIISAERTGSKYYSTVGQLAGDADLIFITTSDDQIENVVAQLCSNSSLRPGQLIIHMSGALPSTILSPTKAFGCFVYSLHPLQAFADVDKSVSDLSNTYFCLEGDEERISILEDILIACKNAYFKLRPEQKTLYHASACMLSNYLVTLIHNSLLLMEDIQIDNSTAFMAMLPLMDSTILNVLELGTKAALTGPIARGDISTVKKQLEAISSSSKDQLKLYSCMAKETLKLAMLSKLKDSAETDELNTLIESYL
ncbi:MAG: hypothetical protein K0Q65_1553 [Clostridia bacterium]|jgi:predicted short-subunit dehydrogenase-like oxidoreductase (DUF2520 family)|nr:hypothetical protein [Clostridia bacterium]